jgi:hypothetical protein
VLLVSCSTCSTRRLASAGQVLGVVNDERGVHAVVRCTCGGVAVWDAQGDPLPALV